MTCSEIDENFRITLTHIRLTSSDKITERRHRSLVIFIAIKSNLDGMKSLLSIC